MRRIAHDPRVEILFAIGLLAALSGVMVAMFLANVRMAVWFLGSLAAALLASGVGLMMRRRWAGIVLAAMSFAGAIAYVAGLVRCDDCSGRVLAVNLAIAVLGATPGVMIVRWRRLLR